MRSIFFKALFRYERINNIKHFLESGSVLIPEKQIKFILYALRYKLGSVPQLHNQRALTKPEEVCDILENNANRARIDIDRKWHGNEAFRS